NAQIDGVLERLDRGELIISDRDPGAVNAIVREGVRRIKADRQKAQTPKAQAARKAKDAAVKRRHQFLIQAALRLPPKRLQHLTGAPTIERLIRDVRKKLGDTVTAATIKQDIRKLPILRAVQEGRITTVKWERYVAKDMRDRYEHVVFRFNKAMMSIFDKLMSLYQKAPKSGCTLLTT